MGPRGSADKTDKGSTVKSMKTLILAVRRKSARLRTQNSDVDAGRGSQDAHFQLFETYNNFTK